MNNANVAAAAVARAYDAQPKWKQRKGTLLQILQALGWVLGVLTTVAADWPEWAALIIGGTSYVVAGLITALTPDGLTPSMVERVAAAAPAEEVDTYSSLRDALAVEVGGHVR